jgi:hypothetical protein
VYCLAAHTAADAVSQQLQKLSSLYALRHLVEAKLAHSTPFASATTALGSSALVRLRLITTTTAVASSCTCLETISTVTVTAAASASNSYSSRRVLYI